MYVLRRIARTQPGKEWEVAGYLSKVCQAYESAGRNKAQIFVEGPGLPGATSTVYAQWTQERIEPTDSDTVPQDVRTYGAKMIPLLTEYSIEFYELVTPEKLSKRGLD